MSRRHKRGWRGPQGRPRRPKPAPVVAAPVLDPVPPARPLTPRQLAQHELMLALIERTKAAAEAEAERDFKSPAFGYEGPSAAELLGGDA